ncbi:MAG: DUF1906 domain-containing protein [Nocardioidaceae bacterium]|nr:DUF1906 domain-containing protein [Nocardioidaceae bacterium]
MLPLLRGRRVLVGLTLAAVLGTVGLVVSSTASTPNPPTPGPFAGYGFDQCEAPSQTAMNAWRRSSPFRAVGIYISGSLRYCQAQTNLTPTWVSTQIANGWQLLPIHLGAQASCTTRDRYQSNKISADATNDYAKARSQASAEAVVAVTAARRLGLAPKSVLFYDLEGFSMATASCRTSSLKFMGAWSAAIRGYGFNAGIYSSAASGMKLLDYARLNPSTKIPLPDVVWIADWNGKADPYSTYIRNDGWPGRRIHQYQGGHTETWGGVKINIDRNWLDLRNLATAPPTTPPPPSSSLRDPKCTSTSISKASYSFTSATARKDLYVPLQCLLKQQRLYTAAVTGTWNTATVKAMQAWQRKKGHPVRGGFYPVDWVSLLAAGNSGTTLKAGARNADVIRVQRALNAARQDKLPVSGLYDARTIRSVAAYQRTVRIKATGVVASLTWAALNAGRWR